MRIDLISDLHDNTWSLQQKVNWAQVQSSNILVIAGDISETTALYKNIIHQVSSIYETVLLIDGNHEHKYYMPNLDQAVEFIKQSIKEYDNVYYLYDNIVTIEDTAFIGRCGWWDFTFGEPITSKKVSYDIFVKQFDVPFATTVIESSKQDVEWLRLCIQSLQNNSQIKNIVVITHTLPHIDFVTQAESKTQQKFIGSYGNSNLIKLLDSDYNKKIKLWLFGHNHDPKDKVINGVRFVSNPRGRPTDIFHQDDYKPVTLNLPPNKFKR